VDQITNINVRGVFLHVLGDALGSVAVICSALFIKYTSYDNRSMADPFCRCDCASLYAVLRVLVSNQQFREQRHHFYYHRGRHHPTR
jgi:Co/Zn/Cd efflux system component